MNPDRFWHVDEYEAEWRYCDLNSDDMVMRITCVEDIDVWHDKFLEVANRYSDLMSKSNSRAEELVNAARDIVERSVGNPDKMNELAVLSMSSRELREMLPYCILSKKIDMGTDAVRDVLITEFETINEIIDSSDWPDIIKSAMKGVVQTKHEEQLKRRYPERYADKEDAAADEEYGEVDCDCDCGES